MKTRLKWQRWLPAAAILVSVLCVTCSDPEDDLEPKDSTDTVEDVITEPDEADAFMNALMFKNSSKKSGALPIVANTMSIKTNCKDTLYLAAGIKMPIRLSHPQSQRIAGVFIAVKNGTFYYDVPVEQEEESDTVSIIFIDISPSNLDLPLVAPAAIIPHDKSDQPIDIIERIITVEEKSGSGCDITVPRPAELTDTSGSWSHEWHWFSTAVFNASGELVFLNAPGNAHITHTAYEGCCDFDEQKNCNILSTDLNTEINVTIAYTILNETFTFFNDGSFVRMTHERKQNFDPETTQWCQGVAGYSMDNSVVTYHGHHDYVSGGSSISYGTRYASCDLCGYGSRGGDLRYTCNMLIISSGVEGAREERVYLRQPTNEWYE